MVPVYSNKDGDEMNERIREIWDKAAESVAAYPSGKDNSWEAQVNFMDKFAQLVVAECMEVFSKDLPEPGDGKMLEVINRVCAVAEHFGVE